MSCRRGCGCVGYRDAADDPGLSHQVHEGILHPHQDVGGHPVAAALLDVGARGVRVVTSRRGRSGRHGAVAHRTRARTGLWTSHHHRHVKGEVEGSRNVEAL